MSEKHKGKNNPMYGITEKITIHGKIMHTLRNMGKMKKEFRNMQ